MESEVIENRLFRLGMWWRIFYGVMRLFVGFSFLNLINTPLIDLLYKVTSTEMGLSSTYFLFNILSSYLQVHPLTVTYFLSIYLIFWGLVDIFLSASLLKKKIWAFPITLWLIALFVIYMSYRFTITHSVILFGTIIFDLCIFWLISREFKKVKANISPK